MRAVSQNSVGGPEVLSVIELPRPEPSSGDVLVRVLASGINPVDAAVRAGYYPLLGKPPFVLGWDISGIIEAVGPGVSGYAVGDEVFGMPRFPAEAAAYAEFVAAPAAELVPKPKQIDHAHAAGLPLAGLTAWQALVRGGRLQKGQRALIHAAAGGVGHLAVQIAKAKGAHVIATASTGKVDFVRSLGADEVIDYKRSDFTRETRDVDLVLESLGGEHAAQSLETLKPGGVMASLLDVPDRVKADAQKRNVRIERIGVRPDRDGLLQLSKLVEDGRLKVHVARTFPLAEAGAAHDFLAGHPIGKVVLTG